MVGLVQRVEAAREQLHGLAYAARLVDAALLADRQMHGQVQERIGAARRLVVVARHGGVGIGEVVKVLGVLGNPEAGQGFNGLHRRIGEHLGAHPAEEAPHIGLGRVEHDGAQRSTGTAGLAHSA
ncbi:hypothetical protein D3C86_1797550 [compost metagenome]